MPNDLREWARMGATSRLNELRAEERNILTQFPDLGDGRRKTSTRAPRTGRKRTMSAAARKLISEAQKKRWAAKKQADGAKTIVRAKKK